MLKKGRKKLASLLAAGALMVLPSANSFASGYEIGAGKNLRIASSFAVSDIRTYGDFKIPHFANLATKADWKNFSGKFLSTYDNLEHRLSYANLELNYKSGLSKYLRLKLGNNFSLFPYITGNINATFSTRNLPVDFSLSVCQNFDQERLLGGFADFSGHTSFHIKDNFFLSLSGGITAEETYPERKIGFSHATLGGSLEYRIRKDTLLSVSGNYKVLLEKNKFPDETESSSVGIYFKFRF